ncbi:hypothetical protein BLNAU_21141 [Blattamonas nauphoetae]|uniref:Uncharacterized protein n=1 Tax=Blattamonas nauphoetae TaxID=2049346 RepID=A0ABQ9WX98_9EUKA|nr:hypothetical protein BLNAU_21141 [Blattamonas nauphoetae]
MWSLAQAYRPDWVLGRAKTWLECCGTNGAGDGVGDECGGKTCCAHEPFGLKGREISSRFAKVHCSIVSEIRGEVGAGRRVS